MKSYHLKNRSGLRSAFTLVEMLMVILIIGILVGLVGFAASGAFRAAQEFTITQEVMQLEAQIEQFKTKYGFYPPTIGSNAAFEVNSAAKMRRYLNRISPNNAESSGTGLANWWENVGQHLNEKSSLVFWLSGLCKSKQYPLSGSAAIAGNDNRTLAPYNAACNYEGGTFPECDHERDVQFEFNEGQLEIVDSSVDPNVQVAVYNQPNGKDNGDSAYRYLDNKSYSFPAYHDGFDTTVSPNVPINFFNPTTFQLVAPGMDGLVWQKVNSATGAARTLTTNIQGVDEGQLDNITNFTQGRLDKEVE